MFLSAHCTRGAHNTCPDISGDRWCSCTCHNQAPNPTADPRVGDIWAHRSDSRTVKIHAVPSNIAGPGQVDVILLTADDGCPMPTEPYTVTEFVYYGATPHPLTRTIQPFSPQAMRLEGLFSDWHLVPRVQATPAERPSDESPRMFEIKFRSTFDGDAQESSCQVRAADAADEFAAQLRELLAAGHLEIRGSLEDLPF